MIQTDVILASIYSVNSLIVPFVRFFDAKTSCSFVSKKHTVFASLQLLTNEPIRDIQHLIGPQTKPLVAIPF